MSVSVLHPRAQRLEAACCPLPSQLRTALHPHSLAAAAASHIAAHTKTDCSHRARLTPAYAPATAMRPPLRQHSISSFRMSEGSVSSFRAVCM